MEKWQKRKRLEARLEEKGRSYELCNPNPNPGEEDRREKENEDIKTKTENNKIKNNVHTHIKKEQTREPE